MHLELFLNELKHNPYVGNQEQCGRGKDYWNADYWTIEVTRHLILNENYFLPEKFKGNKHADPNRIKRDANIKIKTKNLLQEIKNNADSLLVCEVGRGLDIVIANQVKKWRKIYCYDQVDYGLYLERFENIKFFNLSSSQFDQIVPCENVIMIMNHSLYKPFRNDKIIHAIVDGELKW